MLSKILFLPRLQPQKNLSKVKSLIRLNNSFAFHSSEHPDERN